MSNTKTSPTCYEIRVEGHLPPQWADWFDGLAIRPEMNGQTLISGPVADQSALYGLLKKVRDLGLPLLAVNRIPSSETLPDHSNQE